MPYSASEHKEQREVRTEDFNSEKEEVTRLLNTAIVVDASILSKSIMTMSE